MGDDNYHKYQLFVTATMLIITIIFYGMMYQRWNREDEYRREKYGADDITDRYNYLNNIQKNGITSDINVTGTLRLQ